MIDLKRTISFAFFVLAAIYGYAILFNLINEHFDQASPTMLEGVVVNNGMRYNPLPINVIDFQTSGSQHRVDVLETTANGLRKGDPIKVVEKPGLLGKTWYEEAAFHDELESSRTFQGTLALVILCIITGACCRAVLQSNRRVLGFATLAFGLLSGLGLFYVIP